MSEWEDHDREFIEKAESSPEIRYSRSKHWRLMEGALVTNKEGIPARVLKVEKGRALLCTGLDMSWADATPSYYFPVLSDPATLGCLVQLVREAWGGKVSIMRDEGWWEVETGSFYVDHETTGSYEVALLEALEATE